MEDVIRQLVLPFAPVGQRFELISRLNDFVNLVKSMGVSFDLWIDGSFTTKKPEPSDIDTLLVISDAAIKAMDPYHAKILSYLVNNRKATKARYGIDLYFTTHDNSQKLQYWEDFYGHSRIREPKGIVKLVY